MACDLTAGRSRTCKSGSGGVAEVYLFNYLADPFTVVDGVATGMNASLTEAFKYELEGDLNTLVESMVGDRNTGTSVNTQTTTLSLTQIDAVTSAQMNLMAKGFPMAVLKDRNGVYNVIGIDDAIDFTVEANRGGAKGDFNGYTLTGVSTTKELAPALNEATISAFLLAVVL